MKIVFVHCNYPGQFAKLAPALGAIQGVHCAFITQSDNPQNIIFPGVELKKFDLHRDVGDNIHPYLVSTELAVLRGQAVARSIDQLIQSSFRPDVAIVHGGQGLGLFLKECFPWVRVISYMEWYFRHETSRWMQQDYSLDKCLRTNVRNWIINQELMSADNVVVPTSWQAIQFPELWQNKLVQIFDGVDTNFFHKPLVRDLSSLLLSSGSSGIDCFIPEGSKLLTYATRGMEPLRGFPQFMRAAFQAIQHDPSLHVVVAGNDRTAYSYRSSHHSGSWRQEMMAEIEGRGIDQSRIHFPGLINYGELLKLFHRSNLHCYFTRPFVMSWSLFQAASAGTPLLINRCPAFEGIFQIEKSPPQVDLDCQDLINQKVIELLGDSCNGQALDYQMQPGFDLTTSLHLWDRLLFA